MILNYFIIHLNESKQCLTPTVSYIRSWRYHDFPLCSKILMVTVNWFLILRITDCLINLTTEFLIMSDHLTYSWKSDVILNKKLCFTFWTLFHLYTVWPYVATFVQERNDQNCKRKVSIERCSKNFQEDNSVAFQQLILLDWFSRCNSLCWSDKRLVVFTFVFFVFLSSKVQT